MTSHLKIYFTQSQNIAIGLIFTSMGFLFGNWVTMIPYVKQKFSLNDAQLGLLLLSMPFASTLMNPLTTLIINRFGIRQTTVWGALAMAAAYALPVNAPTLILTSISLMLVGMSIATTNVAMNTCVTTIEQQEGIFIMSTSHGMFSAGGMLGSALASLLIGLNVAPIVQMLLVSGSIIVLVLVVKPIIWKIQELPKPTSADAKFVWPRGALLGMIAISLCVNITEGSMADWTAVYMREVVRANDFFIGWGFAFYAFLMATGRFLGDALIPKFGTRGILVMGGITAAIGITTAIGLPYTFSSIVGFGLVGAGVSCGSPILYGSAARLPNMAPGAGLATMNTFSIAGFLAGPAIIGLISNTFNLSIALALIAILALIWSLLSKRTVLY
ncbi:MAG: MFS transporter [Runella sp.]